MAQPTFTVFPMRFSADPGAMIRFLHALGLRKTAASEDGAYAEFEAASGRVAVHGTEAAVSEVAAGETALSLAVADVDAAVAELGTPGDAIRIRDETYGRSALVRAPDGRLVGLSSGGEEHHGYPVHEQVVAASLDVVAVWYSRDFGSDAAFFARFGFEPFTPIDDPWWCALRADRRSGGVIGLHTPNDAASGATDEAPAKRPALVHLGFETSEPLDALAARLQAAGYAGAAVTDDQAGSKVVVTDPDGQHLEIHPTI